MSPADIGRELDGICRVVEGMILMVRGVGSVVDDESYVAPIIDAGSDVADRLHRLSQHVKAIPLEPRGRRADAV